VELSQSEELQNLSDDWVQVVDTSNSGDEVDLWGFWDEESTFCLSLSSLGNEVLFGINGGLVVAFSSLEVFLLLFGSGLLQGSSGG